MYCKICGAKLDDDARFCPMCGTAVNREPAGLESDDPFDIPDNTKAGSAGGASGPNAGQAQQNSQGQEYSRQAPPQGGYYQQPPYYYPPQPVPQSSDARSGGFAALCFFFPIVGLILYIIWHDTLPLRAKSCGKGALAGVITYICLIIVYVIIVAAVLA
ncbi:MAG: zinc ribbon domain-containing protein [Clostridia bacterium]|nr:zinc ribbon domain-containing protein [Clostridia bacterium]